MSILPAKRGARIATYAVVILGYMAILWFYVFPWLDRTFVNRPALG
jgi:quinol-cytochrome oxidoreductase complex cytochrome b subunit